jgi:TRAP-type C4-dicarboxylate transport system permease small subunit
MSVPLVRRRYVLYPTQTRRNRAHLRAVAVERALPRFARLSWRTSVDVLIAGAFLFGICAYGIVILIWGLATK